ncbi:MAG TPA: alpha/beta fold hydrolase [Casimicrobiaceae bacterium]|nr:alpha/beta fold hydrolase [Casimicrobiaceae bacterium]
MLSTTGLDGRGRTLARLGLVLGAVALLAGCTDTTSSRQRIGSLVECTLPRIAQSARCGEIEVPENRDKPDGRKIRIAFAVLAANTLDAAPDPLVLLAGGPGQAASYLGPLALQLNAVRRYRDIVLVDQRGTGRSAPLKCAAFVPADTPELALEIDPVPRATQCAKELADQGVDAAQYTTANWILDLEAVRAALGYPQLNLWGGSYGTRAAQEYARRFPQHVRTMVLDGVATPALKVPLDVWPTRQAAIAAAFDACLKSAACKAGHTDLKTAIGAIDERLSGGRDIALTDPRTGEVRTMHVTLDHVIAAFQALVYLPEFAALLPEATRLATTGDLGPLYAAASAMTSGISEQLDSALYYSVTCTEDVPRITPEERQAKLDKVYARTIAERGIAVCDAWPHGKAAPESSTPLVSDIPTLLLSGGLDPVTPPAYADEVAKTLRNSRHVIAAGYGHNVSPHACAPRLIAQFIEDAGFANLPESCIRYFEHSTPPPAWPDRLAPRP